MPQNSRRSFLKDLSMGLGAFSIANALPDLAAAAAPKTPRKLGIALVGLGNYATKQLAPALESATDCYLSGIVTGTKEKESAWRAKYGIKKASIYNYENFDSIASNDDIDIVYGENTMTIFLSDGSSVEMIVDSIHLNTTVYDS